jgi:hypothetical protein
VRIGGQRIHLPPQMLALYALYAEARSACREGGCLQGGRCEGCQLSDDDVYDRRPRLVELLEGMGRRPPSVFQLSEEDARQLLSFRDWLHQTRSRLNSSVRRAAGMGPRARAYLVTVAADCEGRRRRGLGVLPGLVSIRS